jgi:hypothetical protein
MLDQPQMLRGKVENCTDVKSTVGWTNIGQPFANIEYYYRRLRPCSVVFHINFCRPHPFGMNEVETC